MPRIARYAPKGLVYHALNRAVARLPLFQKEPDYEAFEQVLGEAQKKFPIGILAYCAMPNHWHFVVRPNYITSLTARVKRFARAVRGHWSIENKLHWMLDVNFAQDDSTTRKGHGPEIASMLRQLALMLLTHYPSLKGSIKGRRKIAGWNNGVLEQILAHFIGI